MPGNSLHTHALRARLIASLGGAALLACANLIADQSAVLAESPDSSMAALFASPLSENGSETVTAISVASLDAHFLERGYTLDGVRREGDAVPRLFLARAPSDLPRVESPDQRKEFFIKMLLPLVLAENERIQADREKLAAIVARAETTRSATERLWLEDLADKYGLEARPKDWLKELTKRVDIVPPSMALGQAALESGWGTSRGAQRSASPFGMMSFGNDGERSWVMKFEELSHAVEAYARNLNTHKAYTTFRAKRAEQRSRGLDTPDGYELALTLSRYSERKMDYVRDVRGIIKANKLKPLDAAKLEG